MEKKMKKEENKRFRAEVVERGVRVPSVKDMILPLSQGSKRRVCDLIPVNNNKVGAGVTQ